MISRLDTELPSLTDDQIKALIVALGRVRGPSGFTAQEAKIIVDDASATYAVWLAYLAVIAGELCIDVQDHESTFIHPKHLAHHQKLFGYKTREQQE